MNCQKMGWTLHQRFQVARNCRWKGSSAADGQETSNHSGSKDLSECFNDRLMSLTRDYHEIILVFATYRDHSLKCATGDKRRHGIAPVQYQVRDDTNIKHIPMNRFLSHDKTKADLANYLAAKTLQYNNTEPKLIITSSSVHTISNGDLLF